MSEPINDGGPAFPHSSQPLDLQGNPLLENHSEWGMSLRDYFAGQVIQGLNANPHEDFVSGTFEQLAESAYKQADEMLKARAAK